MEMYRARFGKIEKFAVLKETAAQVVFLNERGKEQRENKTTDWYSWHKSWDEAKAHLVAEAQAKVDSLRLQLERANGELGQRKGMKAPANAGVNPRREAASD